MEIIAISTLFISYFIATYRSLNGMVAQSKNCPFAVNTTIEHKNITTCDSTDI